MTCKTTTGPSVAIDDWPYFTSEWHNYCTVHRNTENSTLIASCPRCRKPVRPYELYKFNLTRPIGRQRWKHYVPGEGYVKYWKSTTPLRAYGLKKYLIYTQPSYIQGSSYNLARAKVTRRFYNAADALDVSLAVTLGEAPKTFGLIAQTASSFYNAFKSFKRLDISEGLKSLGMPTGGRHARSLHRAGNNYRRNGGDFLGDKWLEMKYGWFPLVSDVHNAVELMGHEFDEQDAEIYVKGSATVPIDTFPTPFADKYLVNKSFTGKTSVRIGAYYRVNNATLRANSSLGLTDIASVAWELMPWSFVIDWFSPIGDTIAAMNALGGLEFVDGYETQFTTFDGQVASVRGDGSALYDHFFEEGLHGFVYMKRVKLTDSPSVLPILSSKKFKDLLNMDKAVTSIALLNSVKRR